MNLVPALRGVTGSGVGRAVAALHRAENDLAVALLDVSHRHAADHEIHFVARDLARWSRDHVGRLAESGRGYGLDLDPEPRNGHRWPARVKLVSGRALGRLQAPAVLLLADLRDLHCAAAGVSLDWEVLAQSAQAAEHSDLIGLAADCHPHTLRQLRWTNAQIKELAAQATLAT
jgi:hypothetical protein